MLLKHESGSSSRRWQYHTERALKPASFASRKQSPTAATVCPRFVSRATSS